MSLDLRSALAKALLLIATGTCLAQEGASSSAASGSAEWNQFRGPDRTGISSETGLARSWPEGGPPILWRRPLGEGFAGISTSPEKVCTSYALEDQEYLGCFRKSDGSDLWRAPLGDIFRENFGNGPRATPTIDGEMIYGLGSKGRVVAANLDSGKIIWQLELTERYRITGPQSLASANPGLEAPHLPVFGYSASPLVEAGLLILQTGASNGNSVVALDAATGEERWTVLDDEIGYSSPITVDWNDQRLIVLLTGSHVTAVSPAGDLFWHYEWPVSSAQPIFLPPDRFFVSTVNDVGALMFQVETSSDEPAITPVWELHRFRNAWNSSIAYQDHIYGFDYATFRCVTDESGELRWAKRGLGQGTFLLADDLLIVLSDRGKLSLAEASPEGYVETGSLQVLQGRSWTAPALAGGVLYLRNHEEMVAVNIHSSDG